MSAPRIVTVWCADWPMTAARVPPDRAAAVFHANRVVACTPAARAAGVLHGQRRRSAQGACPGLEVVDADPDRDARCFEPVIRAVADLVPRVEVVEPGWISFAARGPSRYFGGDEALAHRLVQLVGRVAHDTVGVVPTVGVGVADGRIASTIAARRGVPGAVVVPPGGSAASLASLPVHWLHQTGEVPADLVDLLSRLGIRTLGALAALDRVDVTARFGTVGLRAHRLAGGDDERLPDTVDPPPERCAEHPFPEPVERLDTVVFVAKRLADDLTGRLAAEGRVCVRMVVVAETEFGDRTERVWYRDAGLSSPAIVERVRWQLDGWVAQPAGPSGGVVLLRIAADVVRSDDGVATRLWGGRSQADTDAVRAVTRLTGLAGESAVRVPVRVGGRLSGDRYRWVPAATVDLDDPAGRLEQWPGPWPGAVPSPVPTLVFPEPVPAEVLDADGRLVVVGGRGDLSAEPAVLVVHGRRHEVVSWAGPWPVDERWWHPSTARRLARFQIVTDRGEAHLVTVERRRWTLVATYA